MSQRPRTPARSPGADPPTPGSPEPHEAPRRTGLDPHPSNEPARADCSEYALRSVDAHARPTEPEFYYVPDMAMKLSLTEGGVRAMVRRGELPMFKVGRAYRITPERYRRWCREQEESQERARREGDRVAGLIAHYWPRRRSTRKTPKRFPLPPTE